jgi:hypothetical protein
MLRPGHGIPFSHVTLPCRGNRYATDIIVYGKLPPGWNPIQDTEKRSRKLGIACGLLSRDMH